MFFYSPFRLKRINLALSVSESLLLKIKKILLYGFILIVPMMFGLFLLGPKMIKVIYGSAYADAGLSLAILSWAVLPLFINNVLFSILIAFDKLKKTSKIYLFSLLASLILTFLLCFEFKLQGADIAFVLSNYLLLLLLAYETKIKKGFNQLIKPLFSSLVMSLIIVLLFELSHSFKGGLFLIVLGAIVYFTTLYLVKGISKEDLKVLKLLK